MKKKQAAEVPDKTEARNRFLANVLAPVGLMLVLLATLVPFFMMHVSWAQAVYPMVYGIGAVILLGARLFTSHSTTDLRLRSLYRLEKWSPILFIAALVVLWYNPETLRDWLAFTMAGAALQVFTGFAIPARLARSKDKN